MQVPLHPLIVHFPIALTFIVPILIIIFALMIKNHKMSPKGWLIVVGIQFAIVATGYISLETGETEEEAVEKVVSKNLIHEHEEAAEIFVGSTVLALVLSIGAFFIRKELQFPIKLGIAALSVVSCYLAYQTGILGGELVYKQNAGSAYLVEEGSHHESKSSEAKAISPDNESLKRDENDYPDEPTETSDEDLKQED